MVKEYEDHLEEEGQILIRLISGIAGAFFVLLGLYIAYNTFPPSPPEGADGQGLYAPGIIIVLSVLGGVFVGFALTYKKNRTVSKRIVAHGGSILLAPAIPLIYLITIPPEYDNVTLTAILDWHTIPGYVAIIAALCILFSEYVIRGSLLESRQS